MKKMSSLLQLSFGFLLKVLFNNVRTENIIVVGSSSGKGFTDNGKHLFLYFLPHKKNIFFVTKSYPLYKELRKKYGVQVLYNFSYSGIRKILQARYYFFTTNRGDIVYSFNPKTKKVHLGHGMPIKCAGYDYKGKGVRKNKFVTNLFEKYAVGFANEDVDNIISTALFFNSFLATAWNNDKVVVMSYPRNNYLEDQKNCIRKDGGIKGSSGHPKKILYMPTHRDYGYGKINPFIFYDDPKFRSYLADSGHEIKYRFHPNMRKALLKEEREYNLTDLIDTNSDAQDAMADADVLISDYSSCVFDFLICEKPIIFFLYDDYSKDDNQIYYPVSSLDIGPIAKNQDELRDILIRIVSDTLYRNSLIENIKLVKDRYLARTNGWEDFQVFFDDQIVPVAIDSKSMEKGVINA
ncbi:MAG: CDP-glycerol glycerophosphotransferase family protein [Thermoproteota archaeon]|nr:CDP-glycerol glycerophosphotransferase family protein [Thermoproteota archaeon]